MNNRFILSTSSVVASAAVCTIYLAASRPASAAVTCEAPLKSGSKVCPIDQSIDPVALCNDGTTPKFWVRPGKSTHWVIWLEGGDFCADQTSCSARKDSLLTSNGFTAQDGAGVLSPKQTTNPNLYDANTVLVHYCSSDRWSGAYSPPVAAKFDKNNVATWSFQGRAAALAAVATLSELGLNFSNASQIVLGGSSAGAMGITLTANDIIPTLPKSAAVLLSVDAGFGLNIGQFDPGNPPNYSYTGHPNAFEMLAQAEGSFWHGRGDRKCVAQGTDPSVCFNTSFILQQGLIAVPTFVDEAQYDQAQLTFEICPKQYGKCSWKQSDPKQLAFGNYFANKMASLLIGSGTPAAYSVYSPDDYIHIMLTNSLFLTPYNFPSGKISPRDAFETWYADPTGPREVLIGSSPNARASRYPSVDR